MSRKMSRKATPVHEMTTDNESPELATVNPNYDKIAALGYELWLGRGCPSGSPEVDWFRAEEELKNPSEARAA